MKYTAFAILFVLLVFGCTKSENKMVITDQTYIIKADNFGIVDIPLTIKTSLEKEKTVIIPANGKKDISILAAPGEYVKFTVTKVAAIYTIVDSKGVVIAHYGSFPTSTASMVELDFIAYPVNDTEKNFIKYKTGLAKAIAENLVGRPYFLRERYYLENGIKTNASWLQESCTYNDEYQFIPYPAELGNFNPERMVFTTTIDKGKSSCTYGPGEIFTNRTSVIRNEENTVSFPIWDQLAVDGSPSAMMSRLLTIDSINSSGTLTLSRETDSNKKEVFVYKPK